MSHVMRDFGRLDEDINNLDLTLHEDFDDDIRLVRLYIKEAMTSERVEFREEHIVGLDNPVQRIISEHVNTNVVCSRFSDSVIHWLTLLKESRELRYGNRR